MKWKGVGVMGGVGVGVGVRFEYVMKVRYESFRFKFIRKVDQDKPRTPRRLQTPYVSPSVPCKVFMLGFPCKFHVSFLC